MEGLRIALLLLIAIVHPFPSTAQESPAWPAGLREAAVAHRDALRAEQDATRQSSAAAPRGIEKTMQFDRAAHACHTGPAQTVKEYGEPEPVPAASGTWIVRYPFRLLYRQAFSLDELFGKEWRWSSDGRLEVPFTSGEGGWRAGKGREFMDLTGPRPKGRGDGEDQR